MGKFEDLFKGIKEGQKIFGENISGIVSFVLLTIIYFIGVGLTSITAKIFRKKFLELKIDKKKKTYWEDLNLTKDKLEDYYRQF